MIDQANISTTYTYDGQGYLTKVTNTSDGETTYSYDEAGNKLPQTETKPDGSQLDYSYDATGNKTQLITTLANGSSQTTTYTYDKLNRLENVTDTHGTTGYGYDAVGNRSSISYPNGTSQTYQYDTLNRLTLLRAFDGNGALLQSTSSKRHCRAMDS